MAQTKPKVIALSEIDTSNQIGSGSVGKIYRCEGLKSRYGPGYAVAKLYKLKDDERISDAAMQSIIDVPDKIENPKQRARYLQAGVWPTARIVNESNETVGVTMPLIPDHFFLQIWKLGTQQWSRVPSSLQFFVQEKELCEKIRAPQTYLTTKQAVKVADDLTKALGIIHKSNVIYGDVSFLNVLVAPNADPSVMFVDCDAVRISGSRNAFLKQLHSPDWQPPECTEALRAYKNQRGSLNNSDETTMLHSRFNTQSIKTDRYKLGLAIGRILIKEREVIDFRGYNLPQSVQALLKRCIEGDRDNRPSPAEWHSVLSGRPARQLATTKKTPIKKTPAKTGENTNKTSTQQGYQKGKDGKWLKT